MRDSICIHSGCHPSLHFLRTSSRTISAPVTTIPVTLMGGHVDFDYTGITEGFKKKLLRHLVQREKGVFGNTSSEAGAMPVADIVEITYVVEDVWGNRSAFSDSRQKFEGLTLTRFDRSKPALPYNLVFVSPEEAKVHDAATLETGGLPASMPTSPHLLQAHATLKAIEKSWGL